ncbi:Dirigent protein - like 9 [Theobroma cacao]|nr:Dirigent protein - like 9 [Theobroma cacao]
MKVLLYPYNKHGSAIPLFLRQRRKKQSGKKIDIDLASDPLHCQGASMLPICKNPSAVMVARPSITTAFNNTPAPFGRVFATDDSLTIGPDPKSEGEFNGSYIGMFSRNPITQGEREVVVVGGIGKFRMAKGFFHCLRLTLQILPLAMPLWSVM